MPHVELLYMRIFNGKEALGHGSQLSKFATPARITGYH